MVLQCSILLFQARVYYIFVGVAGLALGQSNDLPTYFVNNILHNSTASLSLFFNGFFLRIDISFFNYSSGKATFFVR